MDDYTALREASGISMKSVARALGVNKSAPGSWEQRRPANPLVSSLVRYGEAVGIRPVLTVDGVDAPPPATVPALLACGYVGAACLAWLVAARQHLGVGHRELAARAGLSPRAVYLMERDDHEPHLGTLQGYARVLGGRLTARWETL